MKRTINTMMRRDMLRIRVLDRMSQLRRLVGPNKRMRKIRDRMTEGVGAEATTIGIRRDITRRIVSI